MTKILIADDSIAVRKVAERLLTEAGLGVELAANGEEALAYLSKERPDAIVSDVIMPDKSGYEVCAFVRGNSALASTPVLLISGIVNDEVTKQAESCRADGVLKKPFQGTSLKDRVFELLAQRQPQATTPRQKPGPSQATATTGLEQKPGPSQATATTGPTDTKPLILERAADTSQQISVKLREVEEQLRREQARADALAKRVAELNEELRRARASEALLSTERQRITDLEAKIAGLEQQVVQVPQLKATLKAADETIAKFRQDAATWQQASAKVTELEATVLEEREAAEQLVEQLGKMDKVAAHASDLEVALAAERSRVGDLKSKITAVEQIAMKVQELEGQLTVERDRNAFLARRVTETESVAENATKRLEDMVRRLGEIAELASQLGKGTG